MTLSITSWSFPSCTLSESVGICKALGIGSIDLGYFYRPAIDKAGLLRDPDAAARVVRNLGLRVPSLFHLFGNSVADRNLADLSALEQNAADFRAVAQFCRAASIPTVMVLPGVTNPGQTKSAALKSSAHSLRSLVRIADPLDVTVTVEPHVHAYLDSPAMVQELLREVPGLRLTLDYAHFICMGFTQDQIDVLLPHAAHIHLRQARPGALQAKFDQGVIDFVRLIGALDELKYGGSLAIEYVHQAYMDTLYDDVLTETITMRDVVRAWKKSGVS